MLIKSVSIDFFGLVYSYTLNSWNCSRPLFLVSCCGLQQPFSGRRELPCNCSSTAFLPTSCVKLSKNLDWVWLAYIGNGAKRGLLLKSCTFDIYLRPDFFAPRPDLIDTKIYRVCYKGEWRGAPDCWYIGGLRRISRCPLKNWWRGVPLWP